MRGSRTSRRSGFAEDFDEDLEGLAVHGNTELFDV